MTRTEEQAFVEYLKAARTTPTKSEFESKPTVSPQERYESACGHRVYGESRH